MSTRRGRVDLIDRREERRKAEERRRWVHVPARSSQWEKDRDHYADMAMDLRREEGHRWD